MRIAWLPDLMCSMPQKSNGGNETGRGGMRAIVLSLFPGIGMLDMAFEEEGFCIVRGPDLLWGGDIRKFHPPEGKFDGIIGGPPCQCFSRLRHIVKHNGYQLAPNMIPEFERCVFEAQPLWFLMENVLDAPKPQVAKYFVSDSIVEDVTVGGETSRKRRFSFGSIRYIRLEIDQLALWKYPEPCVTASGGYREQPIKIGGSGKQKKSRTHLSNKGWIGKRDWKEVLRLQGLPDDFDLPSFTMREKYRAIGNGVPIAMGRAVAKAVKKVLEMK